MILVKIGIAKNEKPSSSMQGDIVQQSDRIRTKCYEISGNVKL